VETLKDTKGIIKGRPTEAVCPKTSSKT